MIKNRKNQRGATLAIALVMLLIISLLAISAIQVSQMQEKMSVNIQDKEISFRASESALSAGEDWILGLSKEPVISSACSSFPCVRESYRNISLIAQAATWWQSNSGAYTSQLKNVASLPRYTIEYLQFVPDSPVVGSATQGSGVHYYRVTARGSGANNEAVTILQTTLARRY